MKIKTIKNKGFISIEILLLFFFISVVFTLQKEYVEKITIWKKIKGNKKRLLILKKYLYTYMTKFKCLPPINESNEIDFNKDNFLNEIPEIYKKDINNKPFKVYKGNLNANEVIYLNINEDMNYKVIIYGHDINIYNPKELKEFFHLKEKKSIILINNEHKCS